MRKYKISRESQHGPASEAADVSKHIDRLQWSKSAWRRQQSAAIRKQPSLTRREAESTATLSACRQQPEQQRLASQPGLTARQPAAVRQTASEQQHLSCQAASQPASSRSTAASQQQRAASQPASQPAAAASQQPASQSASQAGAASRPASHEQHQQRASQPAGQQQSQPACQQRCSSRRCSALRVLRRKPG